VSGGALRAQFFTFGGALRAQFVKLGGALRAQFVNLAARYAPLVHTATKEQPCY
jgi:hypothetical protein